MKNYLFNLLNRYILTFLVSLICFKNANSEKLIKPKVKILILGNSITHHGPATVIGWNGDWGMAASVIDSDYVHVLIKKLKNKYANYDLDFREQNIADWEKNFDVNLEKFDLVNKYDPNVLIIRLGENVTDDSLTLKYEGALLNLVKFYRNQTTQVLITGNFWPSKYKDSIQKKVSIDNGFVFVDISELAKDNANFAYGKFSNWGVSYHPSDIGMRKIAESIFESINDRLIKKALK